MRANHLRLITLGRLALVSSSGDDESLTKRRRQLAVLAVLALNERPVSREQLVDMFWRDEDEDRARHSLSNALSSIRSFLGATAIATRQTDVGLSREARLGVDALEFSAACEAANHERAVELYTGPFLDGVVVPNSSRFDSWATRERARLERQFLQACESHCNALSRAQRWQECATVAARWLDALPPSRAAATTMLSALAAPGTKEALYSALTAYDALARRLEHEYESPPDPRVTQLAAGFREQLLLAPDVEAGETARETTQHATQTATATDVSPVAALPATSSDGSAPAPTPARSAGEPHNMEATSPRSPVTARTRQRPWKLWAAAAIVVAGSLAAAGYGAMSVRQSASESEARPLIAVTNVVNVRRDTSIAWLEDGLKQMIAADLSHSNAVDVVPPSRVQDVLVRAGYSSGTAISTDQATDVARRVNATLAVSAELSHGGGGYVVGVNVFDVSNGKLVRMSTVTGTDILSVADAIAARVLDVVNSATGTPHFADIETSSPEAYRRFVRGMQASAAGQFPDDERELDAALALDPGFVSAITARRDLAIKHGEMAVAAQMDSAFARHTNRAANRFFERMEATAGPTDAMHLLHADDLARMGDFAGAQKEFTAFARFGPTDGSFALSGDDARAFAWPRALEADALAASGHTLLLHAIADSLEQVGPRSYYGRDWTLFHHVRGLIAMHEKRYADAEHEFRAARWGYAGWTRTVAELAQAQLAQGRPRDAIATLRHAYAAAPDAMGRYMPRSEVDLRMSNAFRAAGMADSARVYGEYVQRAWKHADPEVKRLLEKLPNS